MREVRSFLRFVLPGLAAILQLALLLLITGPRGLLGSLFGGTAWSLFTLVVVCGGLGYLFAIFYHWGYWQPWLCPEAKYELSKESIRVVGAKATDSHWDQWVRTMKWLHTKWAEIPEVEAVMDQIESLADRTHVLGATAVGTFLAGVFWFVVQCVAGMCWWVILGFAMWLALVWIHYANYQHAYQTLWSLMDLTISGAKKPRATKKKTR